LPRGIFFNLDKFPFTPGPPVPTPEWWDNEDEGVDDD